jgi:hydrogenase-4 component F
MIAAEPLILLFYGVAAASIASSGFQRDIRRILRMPVVTSGAAILFSVLLALRCYSGGTITAFAENILVDSLALFHLFLVDIVFFLSSLYISDYFRREIAHGAVSPGYARRFSMLWQTFQAMLVLVLLSNNIGLMWVTIEATTLVSAFLIISDSDKLSIEAMWKYLLICSVGITFAFMGTVLTIAAARGVQGTGSVYLFSHLLRHPDLIDPHLMLFAFIMIVVGFGTKAGLSPMHTWLPDAHSQAPTPVSAVFSGVMLNCALFAIMRYLPITEGATGHGSQASSILLLFGFLSMFFAAVFIPAQFDLKRFLAYCSVEHMGIIAIGLAIGGAGTFAALLHTANHSIGKILAFYSAGKIGETCGTRDARKLSAIVRRVPWWGGAYLIAVLALIGVAPFSMFMSEFLLAKAAFFTGRIAVFVLFLLFALIIFIGALRHVLNLSFGRSDTPEIPQSDSEKPGSTAKATIIFCVALLLLLGIWIPGPLTGLLENAAAAVNMGRLP